MPPPLLPSSQPPSPSGDRYAGAIGDRLLLRPGPRRCWWCRRPDSDSNAGTAAAPLQSIQVAVYRLPNGGTIELRAWHYQPAVRLAGVHGITIRPYEHEAAVLDGTALTPPNGTSAMVNISDSPTSRSRAWASPATALRRKGIVPIGIYLHGHDNGIHILGNHVHKAGNYNPTLGSFNINAHGIAAYGDDPHAAISDLTISGNTVDHLAPAPASPSS